MPSREDWREQYREVRQGSLQHLNRMSRELAHRGEARPGAFAVMFAQKTARLLLALQRSRVSLPPLPDNWMRQAHVSYKNSERANSCSHFLAAIISRLIALQQASTKVVLNHLSRKVTLTPHPQIAADERFQIAVQNLIHISYFHPRAQVFRHAIRLQDIAPNL